MLQDSLYIVTEITEHGREKKSELGERCDLKNAMCAMEGQWVMLSREVSLYLRAVSSVLWFECQTCSDTPGMNSDQICFNVSLCSLVQTAVLDVCSMLILE